MRTYLFLLLAIVLAHSQIELTSQNFIQNLAANELLFVKFFSPNCGHCVIMAPEYEKFADQSEGKPYKVAEIDCSEHRQLCQQIGVKSYPTLKLFVSGSAFDYQGKRTAEAMNKWMDEITSIKLPKLSLAEAKKKIGKESFVVVSGMSEKVQRVIAITSNLIDYGIKYYSFDSQGYIKLYVKGSNEPLTYTTDQDFPFTLIQWAFQKSRPAVVALESQTLKYAKQQKQATHLLIAIEDENISFEEITSWCLNNMKKILCFSLSKTSSVYEDIKALAKIPQHNLPLFIVRKDFSIGSHYPYQSVSIQNLNEFHQDVVSNKLPNDIDQARQLRERVKFNSVVKLDSKNYKQTIAQNEFVFVFYYSPNCGHCLHFAKEYDRIGAYFKEIGSKVVIAAVDGNEQGQIRDQQKVHGFPHFRLFIRGQKILYRLDRNADKMIQFIESAAKSRLTKVESLGDISDRNYALLTGVPQSTYLHALPALFTNCTIYHIPSQGSFALEVYHGGRSFKYPGKLDFWDIYDWLDVEFSPILSSLGVSIPAKRLEKALIARIPILLVLNKHERSAVDQLLVTLENYCVDKRQFVCGYIHSDEEDYNMLNKWLGDTEYPDNSIFWVDSDTNARHKYTNSLKEVTTESLAAFVEAVKNGSVPLHVKPKEESKESNEEL